MFNLSEAERKSYLGVTGAKNSSDIYAVTMSPSISFVLISARLPFSLICLVRMNLYIRDLGKLGIDFVINLSKR
jgi:hypothetical protein